MKSTKVTLSDGRQAVVREFQAYEFVAAAKNFITTKMTASTVELICLFCEWVNPEGKIMAADIYEMTEADFTKLGSLLQFECTKSESGELLLPSGNTVEIKAPTVRQLVEIEEFPAEHRAYARICALAIIAGKKMDPHDARLMPGGDYIALTSIVSANPT